MKRADGVVVPDSYEKYERLQAERAVLERISKLEDKVKELESWILDK